MNRLHPLPPLLLLLLLLLLCPVSRLHAARPFSLPAPVNLSVTSVNFHHVLHWRPGPGTPPGARYHVYKYSSGLVKRKRALKSANTSAIVKFKFFDGIYWLSVETTYRLQQSGESSKLRFAPLEDTTIEAPTLSLSGCGSCIQISISLPEPDGKSGVQDFHSVYNPTYEVSWRKRDGPLQKPYNSINKSFNLTHLQAGTEYCVQVKPMTPVNRNMKPSAWKCAFTSVLKPNTGPVVAGTAAALVIFILGGLIVSVLFLHHTGFICKLKATLPRALLAALNHGYTLTPERIVPNQISISPVTRRKLDNPPAVRPAARDANSDSEEEEDGGNNIYIDRAAGLCSGESSRQDASGAQAEVPEVDAALDEDEAEGGAEEEARAGVTVEEEEEEEEEEDEEVCDTSGNVNLFSLTFGGQEAREETEEEEEEEEEQKTRTSLTDFLETSHLEPEQSRDQPAPEDFTRSGYEGRSADGVEEEEEEEEEEELSGYMRHR